MKFLSVLAAMSFAASASATPRTAAEEAWNALARADVAAALSLIEESHPGAARDLGDSQFQSLLSTARSNAEKRLPLVRDFYGHAALMNGLANDFRDGHIWSNAIVSPAGRGWAGIIMTRQGGKWIVGAHERSGDEPDLSGSMLLGCDGLSADALARARTGSFYAHPDVEADMARRAYTLLLDDNNPFVTRPRSCQFETNGGQTIAQALSWRAIAMADLEKRVRETARPASAGMRVAPFAGGYWIGVESFASEAEAIVTQVQAQQDALRRAPMVVLDLRGNGGGNSQYAVEIAEALVGEARASAATRSVGPCSGAYWRASAGNAAALKAFADSLPPGRAPAWKAQAEALDAAVKEGRQFSPALPECAKEAVPAGGSQELPPPAMKGRIVLVTDRACFSSCLIAADLFRRLGATHVGEATDMSTRFMEVREIILPSGLRTFSTLQKLALGLGDFGPYEPHIPYPGMLAETDALEAWVSALPN